MNIKKLIFTTLLLLPFFLKATTIPFEYIDGKIVIQVDVKNEKHNFIFDTGALTVVSSELKGLMGAKKSNVIFEAIDANNSTSKMDVFKTSSLKLADLKFRNTNIVFADIKWMTVRACTKISGIFGANMMNGKVWRIDFKTKKISIADKPAKSSSESILISFTEENYTHVPNIDVKIRNQNFPLLFDTGSGSGFTLDSKSYDLVRDDNFLTIEGLLSQSLNSVSKGEKQLDVMEVKIGSHLLGNQIVDSSVDSKSLIGTRFMENYLIDLDFIEKRITLTPTDNGVKYNSFGLAFASVENHFVIINKLKIPQLSELNVGDKIFKINTVDVSKVDTERFCEIKKLMDSTETLIIQNEAGKEFKLQKQDILQFLN